MLRFSDFAYLPEVDELVKQLLADGSGLVIVAGLDSRPAGMEAAEPNTVPNFLPSGRATIFRVLVSELLDAHPRARCTIISEDKDVLHLARRFRSRTDLVPVNSAQAYLAAISEAASQRSGLIVVDRVTDDNAAAVLEAAHSGSHLVSQIDTVLHAHSVARYLAELGASPAHLDGLRWVLSVQRLPALCPICKQPADVSAVEMVMLEALARRHPALNALHAREGGGAFYAPGACPNCNFTGRQGDVAVFDFFRNEDMAGIWRNPSALPMEVYAWMLAQRGQLALTDALNFESHQLRRTHSLLMTSEGQLSRKSLALERKSAELETANRLLRQRTRELVSLEGIGQALITWNDLPQLSSHVLKAANELSKSDRGVLYYLRSAEWGQVLAARGWPNVMEEIGLARGLIYEHLSEREPMDFLRFPPGLEVPANSPPLRSGVAIPLVAHGIPTGLMLIQSTRKSRFTQGERAILSTLAGYAAVAMQRAGLIEQLRTKIQALEEAQQELAQKERLESELALARQVQLSMVPRVFPGIEGLAFAAAYAPARQVGGDFYDVIKLGERRVGLVIADVADKGMAAALYMARARSVILSEAHQHDSPREVLAGVNQLLLESGEQGMFVTVFYGILDQASGILTYARAGHDHPFVIHDGEVTSLAGRGMVLGLFESPTFVLSEESITLSPGDQLVLFTDGLTDVMNPAGEMLSRERLADLARQYAGLTPNAFCHVLFESLDSFRGAAPQFDDMALVVVGLN